MTTAPLGARHQEVLKAVIQDHILMAEPIGSRSLSRRYGFQLSPASIRNTMADLEEAGLLSQPHTSAGRVPTDLGYRLYVDSLMEPEGVPPAEAQRIREGIAGRRAEAEEALRETSRVLAMLTHYTCLVLAPRLEQETFRRIEFVDVGRDRLLAVFVSSAGLVHQRVVGLDEPVSAEELGRISRYLNEALEGKTLSALRAFVLSRMAEEKTLYDRLLARALSLAQKALEGEEAEVFLDGAAHFASQPEFADVAKMRALFAAFEEKSKLVRILDACLRNAEVTVVIGSEAQVPGLAGVSMIASPYRAGGAIVGAVGLLGPTRMPYARMIPLVAYTAQAVSQALSG